MPKRQGGRIDRQHLCDVLKLVGVAGDVDGRDLAVLDLESRGLKDVVALIADIARQAIDPHRLVEAAVLDTELARQALIKPQHGTQADNRIEEGMDLAAAVGLHHDILGEQRAQTGDVAAA